MSEFTPNQEEYNKFLVADIFTECRINETMHDPSGGIKFQIGGVDWAVMYDAGNEYSDEVLVIFRDYKDFNNSMYYKFYASTGQALKNEHIKRKLNGEARIDMSKEVILEETAEIGLAHAIVTTAHHIRRSAA